jgi:hypothetical protein
MNGKIAIEGQGEGVASLACQQVTDEALQLVINRLNLFESHSAPAFLASSWSITAQVVVDSTSTC